MTGSLVNHLMGDRTLQPVPEVGMGATLLYWSDRHAATIVGIESLVKEGDKVVKGTIRVRRDRAIRTDSNGMSESQSYRFEPDPDSPTMEFTFRKTGAWVCKGQSSKGGLKVGIGHRDEYHDFSF